MTCLDASGVGSELPKICDAFHESMAARTCPDCGTVHPGKGKSPVGLVQL